MAFEPDKWADGEEGGTPITAAELNRMEAAGEVAAKTATWGQIAKRPASFQPSEHNHSISEITDLQGVIDAIEGRLDVLETPAE